MLHTWIVKCMSIKHPHTVREYRVEAETAGEAMQKLYPAAISARVEHNHADDRSASVAESGATGTDGCDYPTRIGSDSFSEGVPKFGWW